MKMQNKLLLTFKLMRVDKPTGYILLFFPTFFGLWLANPSSSELIKLLPLFIVGSVVTRSAGCIINDIFDKNFDKHILRTKGRPLANNALTVHYALVVLAALVLCCSIILLLLNITSLYIAILAAIMTVIYPLMKRITYFPQLFLVVTFMLGVLIGYASVQDRVALPVFVMYVACCFWQVGYDTIYGFMDLEDDKKIHIKSLSIWLEHKNYRLWLAAFYIIFITLFMLTCVLSDHPVNYIAVLAAMILLAWQIVTLNIRDANNCMVRFKNNNYIGLVLALGLVF